MEEADRAAELFGRTIDGSGSSSDSSRRVDSEWAATGDGVKLSADGEEIVH